MVAWGYILDMPRCPTRAKQREVMKAFGIETGPMGTCWLDKVETVKRHATAGRKQLEERELLIEAVQAGDRVIVADVLCLGVSPGDAEWFLDQMAEKGVEVVVNGNLERIEPGKKTKAVIDEMRRKITAYHTRVSRAGGR